MSPGPYQSFEKGDSIIGKFHLTGHGGVFALMRNVPRRDLVTNSGALPLPPTPEKLFLTFKKKFSAENLVAKQASSFCNWFPILLAKKRECSFNTIAWVFFKTRKFKPERTEKKKKKAWEGAEF